MTTVSPSEDVHKQQGRSNSVLKDPELLCLYFVSVILYFVSVVF